VGYEWMGGGIALTPEKRGSGRPHRSTQRGLPPKNLRHRTGQQPDRVGNARRERAMTGDGLPRWLTWLASLSLVAVVLALTVPYVTHSSDLYLHMAIGRLTLQTGWPPLTEPFTYTIAGEEFIAHEWLAGVVFYAVYRSAGVVGLVLLKTAVLAGAYTLSYRTARRLGAHVAAILPLFGGMVFMVTARAWERPHLFSFLFTAGYLWILFRFREAPRTPPLEHAREARRWLSLLPCLQVCWVNTHGGHLVGLALVSTFALGEACQWLRTRYVGADAPRALPGADVVRLGLLVPACLGASLLNPYGARLLRHPFEMAGQGWVMDTNLEWMPPWHLFYYGPPFAAYVLQLSVLGLAFLAGSGRPRGQRACVVALGLSLLGLAWACWYPPDVGWATDARALSQHLIVAVFVVSMVVHYRRGDFTHAAIIILFLGLSLRYTRAGPDMALATFPLAASAASQWLAGHMRVRPASVVAGSLLLLSIAGWTITHGYPRSFREPARQPWRLGNSQPWCTVEFMATHGLRGRALTSLALGGLLVFRRFPEVRVGWYGFDYVFGPERYAEHQQALRSPTALWAYLDTYQINLILIGNEWAQTQRALRGASAWANVAMDDRASLFVRRPSPLEAYTLLNPHDTASKVTTQNAERVLSEAAQVWRHCPQARFPYEAQARALWLLHRDDEARRAEQRIERHIWLQ
jgi:hypothetical protein